MTEPTEHELIRWGNLTDVERINILAKVASYGATTQVVEDTLPYRVWKDKYLLDPLGKETPICVQEETYERLIFYVRRLRS